MTGHDPRPTPSVKIEHLTYGPIEDRWKSKEAYAVYVEGVAQIARTKCEVAREAGACCMKLELKEFGNNHATVSASCSAEDCPDPNAVFDPVLDLPGHWDRLNRASRYSQ